MFLFHIQICVYIHSCPPLSPIQVLANRSVFAVRQGKPPRGLSTAARFSSSTTICHFTSNSQIYTGPKSSQYQPRTLLTVSDTWFNEKIAPDGAAEDGCHPNEAQALKDYYRKKTSAKEVAQAITRRIEDSKDPGANLYRLWALLKDALVELPATQIPALIQLLDAIQQLPEPDEHKRDDWHRTLAASDPAHRADLRAEHVKKAEIEARLAVADVGGIPLDWGYDCVADALESRDAVLDFEIPAAAEWIAIAGKRLYAGAVDCEESWALERRRDFGKEGKAMSLERWSFWKKRMEELLQQSEATRDAAKAAVRDMRVLMPNSHGSE
ncbi:MAG: hypothetical protein M1830_006052 [Pleopsidium flavum]|nr:MAG: hypothetical protein M1830_006052 [Pleopsidium flavum]